jgi:uncharacterized protein YeaO (DUF488 family)
MSRHTLSDGVTPHPEITDASFDEWLVELSPPSKLVGDYYKRGLSWDDYEKEYLTFLREKKQAEIVRLLAASALGSDVTILCVEDSCDLCHRRLLALECQRLEPTLKIVLH